jgi:hypothetical protein
MILYVLSGWNRILREDIFWVNDPECYVGSAQAAQKMDLATANHILDTLPESSSFVTYWDIFGYDTETGELFD